jgi:sodium/potassium/calcium exchanger 2
LTSEVGVGTIVGSAVFNVLFVIGACAFASSKVSRLFYSIVKY